jgi:hypothetical protein
VAALGGSVTLLLEGDSLRERVLIKESWNTSSFKGLARLLRLPMLVTIAVEATGSGLYFLVF